jgi:uncharacterized membrane protein (UPF0127 family)
MRVLCNETAWEIDEARSLWSRFRGLMFRRHLDPASGILLEPCSSIHMLFMLMPIDAVFYDRDGRVTRVARRLRPWVGMASGGRGTRGVIELASGAADGVQPGDLLQFDRGAAAGGH